MRKELLPFPEKSAHLDILVRLAPLRLQGTTMDLVARRCAQILDSRLREFTSEDGVDFANNVHAGGTLEFRAKATDEKRAKYLSTYLRFMMEEALRLEQKQEGWQG